MSKPILIVAGQSNAITRGVTGNPPARWKVGDDVQFWTGTRFEPYDPAGNVNWGPEVGYAIAWRGAGSPGGRLRIVKRAAGNTQLAPQRFYGDLGADGMDWYPATMHSLFGQLLTKTCAAIARTPSTPEITLLWVHGEADSRGAPASHNYPSNFAYFVRSLSVGIPCPITRIALSLVSPRYPEAHRDRQRAAAGLTGAVVVDTARYTYQDDGIHLTATSALRLGRDAFRALAGMEP